MIRIAIVAFVLALAQRADAKGCHEVSEVVGRQRCSHFGTWSRDASAPPIWGEVMGGWNNFVAAPYTLDKAPLVTSGHEGLASQAAIASFRAMMGSLVYGGIELDAGALTTIPEASGPTPAVAATYLGAVLVVGVHAALWRFGFGAELAAGGRAIDLEACATKGCSAPSDWQTHRELEARVRFDLFTAPRFSLGVMIGKSIVDSTGTTVMFGMSGHVRAMDGM